MVHGKCPWQWTIPSYSICMFSLRYSPNRPWCLVPKNGITGHNFAQHWLPDSGVRVLQLKHPMVLLCHGLSYFASSTSTAEALRILLSLHSIPKPLEHFWSWQPMRTWLEITSNHHWMWGMNVSCPWVVLKKFQSTLRTWKACKFQMWVYVALYNAMSERVASPWISPLPTLLTPWINQRNVLPTLVGLLISWCYRILFQIANSLKQVHVRLLLQWFKGWSQ